MQQVKTQVFCARGNCCTLSVPLLLDLLEVHHSFSTDGRVRLEVGVLCLHVPFLLRPTTVAVTWEKDRETLSLPLLSQH